jgi:hypothetical protein
MENNTKRSIYYTFCHIISCFALQKVLLLRLGLFSIATRFPLEKKFPIMLLVDLTLNNFSKKKKQSMLCL